MSLKRISSLILAIVSIACVFLPSCKIKEKVYEDKPYELQTENLAYTDGKLDLASKDGFYESFDECEIQSFISEDATKNFTINFLKLVIKKTTFRIVQSDDGRALMYIRSKNSKNTDPYIDIDIPTDFTSSKYVFQADFKLGNDYRMDASLFTVIYRGSKSNFITVSRADKDGNVYFFNEKIAKFNKTGYVNLAVAFDVGEFKAKCYVDGELKAEKDIPKFNLNLCSLKQIRVMQSSGDGTGSMYIDNICTYQGEKPVSMIPEKDTHHAVNETLDKKSVGKFTSDNIRADESKLSLNILESDDKNKFLKAEVLMSDGIMEFDKGGMDGKDYVFSNNVYIKNNSPEFSYALGYRTFLTVNRDGKVVCDEKTVGYLNEEEWNKLAVVVSSTGFEVYINGKTAYCAAEDFSGDMKSLRIEFKGNRGEYIFLDNMKVYKGSLPFEYSGTDKREEFTLIDGNKFDEVVKNKGVSGVCKMALSDKKDENGVPMIRLDNIKLGNIIRFDMEKCGFTGNIEEYKGVSITFYCPKDFDYDIMGLADCGYSTPESWDYYMNYARLDEKGYMTISFVFSEMIKSRNPSYDRISNFNIGNSGWAFGKDKNVDSTGSAIEEELEIYIKSAELFK